MKMAIIAAAAFMAGTLWGMGIMSMLCVGKRRPPVPKVHKGKAIVTSK